MGSRRVGYGLATEQRSQTEYPTNVGQYHKMQHVCNWNARRNINRQWCKRNTSQKYSKIYDRYRTTNTIKQHREYQAG